MTTNSDLPPVRAIFAKRLKALRIPRGYPTARSFAAALEIDENRYTRYERAEVEPDMSLFVKICALLTVSPNDLLDMTTQPATFGGFSESAVPRVAPLGMQPGNEASRRRALAWQLAEEIAKLDTTHATHALDKVARVSRLFGEISTDPFSFISRMTADRRVDSLEASVAARLGEIAEALIEATKSEILGNTLEPESKSD
jgi:transcriptional regulator with XRE-family HTH domain